MQVEELNREASISLLGKLRFGRLACTQGSQPYVVPIHYAYHNDGYIYSFSKLGQKVSWMRANPLVCLEVDEIKNPQNWSSVVVFSYYEELLDTPYFKPLRELAYNLLQQREIWWEPGLARVIIESREHPSLPLFYRIFVEQITGRRASI
jgi:nitroimidazol reductase NimA-like FMN-containing flavoprotein (pyridoxamine 5'-phosphate oxidase superfamily)